MSVVYSVTRRSSGIVLGVGRQSRLETQYVTKRYALSCSGQFIVAVFWKQGDESSNSAQEGDA